MSTALEITPSVAQVAALMASRTISEGGTEVGTFNATTRPTNTQVDAVAQQAVSMLLGQPQWLQTTAIATLLTAYLIEVSFFRDQQQISVYRDMLMRQGYIIPLSGQFGGESVNERTVDTVMMRPGFTEYDPYYPKPPKLPDWPYPGANP